VPHGSLGKGSGTPKNLARSHVLVAKVLTNSDTHGRIILPRVSVEANLTFLMGYRCHLQPITFAISCIFQLSFALTCSASRFRLPVHLHVSAQESLLQLTQGRQCLAVAHLRLLLICSCCCMHGANNFPSRQHRSLSLHTFQLSLLFSSDLCLWVVSIDDANIHGAEDT